MRSDADLAARYSAEATVIADQQGAGFLALRGRLIGTYIRLGRGHDSARTELLAYVDEARSQGWDELASTGYSQLVSLDVEHRRLRAAEHVLEESLPFASSRDIWICEHWQTAVRSRLRFAEGRWKAAVEDAEHVLGEDGMPLARLWPLVVVALVRLRSGDTAGARDHLEEAWVLAGRIDEPLRTLPVLAALAEVQWLTDEDDVRVVRDAASLLEEVAGTPGTAWASGELRQWLRRLGLSASTTASDGARALEVAEPHVLAAEGRAREAALVWQRIGDPFAAAMALADSADPTDRLRAMRELDGLGAVATADRLRVDLRRDGVMHVPARVRASTRANPAGLTNRQLDVARLVARGLTNAEIAGRLFISPKTADHHVSAVLAKLGLTSRRSVRVRADELGLA
jgi:DNA-binding CsgD family transcriptional regulator